VSFYVVKWPESDAHHFHRRGGYTSGIIKRAPAMMRSPGNSGKPARRGAGLSPASRSSGLPTVSCDLPPRRAFCGWKCGNHQHALGKVRANSASRSHQPAL